MKRKILFVVESLFEPGQLSQLKPILRSTNENDFDIHVVSISGQHDSSSEFFGPSVQLHSINAPNRKTKQLMRLRRLVDSLNPEIVHAWGQRSHSMTLLATVPGCCKTVLTFLEMPESKGILWDSSNSLLLNNVFRRDNSVTIVASHKSIEAELFENGLKQNVSIIPNSVPGQLFDRKRSRQRLLKLIDQESSDLYLAGTVSRFEPKYRLKDLVWAIDLLCCIRQDVHLVIFADGYGFGSKALQNFISKTEAANNVHLLAVDEVVDSDIAGLNFYWNAQLENPNPTSMLTAMENEIPVVSVLAAETEDAVLPLQSGLATNYGARDEFARWTKYLIEQPHLAKQLSRQGKQHVENRFPTSAATQAYAALYTSIL